MLQFLGIVGFLGFIIFGVMSLVARFKKTGTAKKNVIISGISFLIMIIAASASPTPNKDLAAGSAIVPTSTAKSTTSPIQTDDAAVKKAAEEKAKADADAKAKKDADDKAIADAAAKAKAEADAKAAEEARKKEKTIKGNGTFAVNSEVKPGTYKSTGKISYWARLSGFSGDLNEILANGNPSGSDVVEIKAADKGFQTTGSGEWILIDDSYNPKKAVEFCNGTYIIGKDIDPGTYKSDGSVSYWAQSYSEKLEKSQVNNTSPFVLFLLNKGTNYYYLLIFFIVLVFGSSFMTILGVNDASKEADYLLISTNPTLLVVDSYKDAFIVAPINIETKTVTTDFQLISTKKASNDSIKFQSVKIKGLKVDKAKTITEVTYKK